MAYINDHVGLVSFKIILFLLDQLLEGRTYINNEVSERSEAARLIFALVQLPSVFDQKQCQILFLSGHFESDVHLFHLFWAAEQSSQDGHGFRRVVFGILPHSLQLVYVAIWR